MAGYNDGSVTACSVSGSVSGASTSYYIGGVVGYNDGSVTACYWSNYSGDGIGYDYSSYTATPTKVDGDWSDAVSAMNSAISTSGWQYEILTGNTLPTLKKQ